MLNKQYYNEHAHEFIEKTLQVDLKPIYEVFESYLKPGIKLLDVGFGSGRDSLHFYKRGYEVVSIDYAEEIVARGESFLNNEVLLVDFQEVQYKDEFDAIWASAVFLHFTDDDILKALAICHRALKSEGYVYLSFKYGETGVMRKGRFFNDFTEAKILSLLNEQANSQTALKLEKMWLTEDARKDHQGKKWINIILKK
ncbi:class I SAM-dependent methyltransferase [Fusibacter paucivorans]|uniref:Class I SAM-dependent methyltransferase n=1 Tax=Fusibacter paucivorans TaxID=76009 RepID=A0ABS5PQA1_9FIRM|nr:class I SAM-dependent methyltransferase [Fusibacter paucivorans]MBS7527238.1 class I SAM-dependent methyltransferase [Fusibacter paucivorans]